MKTSVLLTIFFVLSSGPVFGEIQAVLKEAVYIKKDSISINDLVENIPKNGTLLQVVSNRFFSNSEIQGILNKAGIRETVLIGKGTYVIKTLKEPGDYLQRYLSGNFPGFDPYRSDWKGFRLPEDCIITGISNSICSNDIKLFINCIKFDGDTGELTNFIADFYYNGNMENNAGNDVEDSISLELVNVSGFKADLLYRKGNISIVMKVRIIRMLEDKTCLVENNRSGKIFKVKLKDSI